MIRKCERVLIIAIIFFELHSRVCKFNNKYKKAIRLSEHYQWGVVYVLIKSGTKPCWDPCCTPLKRRGDHGEGRGAAGRNFRGFNHSPTEQSYGHSILVTGCRWMLKSEIDLWWWRRWITSKYFFFGKKIAKNFRALLGRHRYIKTHMWV